MFNFNAYKQKEKQKTSLEELKQHYVRQKERQGNINARLAANYKKRMENFVLSMVESPIITQSYIGPDEAYAKLKREDPEKFLGDAQFYVKGFKHEKDRIQESLERNKDLDFCPLPNMNRYQFRERIPEKEIQHDMHFQAKTAIERIESFIKDHTQTQVENQDYRELKKLFPQNDVLSDKMSQFEKKAYLARQIAKNLLPSLHRKTHFKAAMDMFNSLPTTLTDKQTKNRKSLLIEVNDPELNPMDELKSVKSVQPTETQPPVDLVNKKQRVSDIQESFNPQTTSKDILLECQVIRRRNPKVSSLKSGQGHLISTRDKSISEVYSQLYKSSRDHSIL